MNRKALAKKIDDLTVSVKQRSHGKPKSVILTDHHGVSWRTLDVPCGTGNAVYVSMPPKIIDVFGPERGEVDYRGAFGGRGSGKSFNLAKMAAILGFIEPLRILCTRELQVSIQESFHAEVKNAIESETWLSDAYDVGENYVRGFNGTKFIFKGLRHNITAIKSMAQIDICVVEEAEDVPEYSWVDLDPTIRAPKSEIWPIWNPKKDGSPTDIRFKKKPPARSRIVEMNHRDNPFFTERLENTRLNDQMRMDTADYNWIWEGKYLKHSKEQIFANRAVTRSFEPTNDFDGPYYGIDFGFSQDPSTCVKCWVFDNKLYIEYDVARVGLDIDDTADMFIKHVPGVEHHTSRADCARPESISFLRKPHPKEGEPNLPMIESCTKWPGSVEDGITFMKSFDEIVIHPRCIDTANEFANYSYKVDRLTGDVLTDIVDDHNHLIDAIRYALGPMIQSFGAAGVMEW